MGKYDDNPAGRLHSILEKLKQYDADDVAGRVRSRDVWAALLEVDREDTVALYRGIGLLLEQVDKAEKLIRDMPEIDPDLYLLNFPTLRQGIATPSINSGWSDQRKLFSPVVLRDLAFCASKIAEFYSEGIIEQEELASLAEEVNRLFDAVVNATLNQNLRELLLDLLETMRRAIAEYKIRGAAGLREALTKGVGAVVIMAQQAAEPEEQSTVKRVFSFLEKVDKVIARLAKYKPILVSIGQKLLPGAGDGDIST